MESSGNLSYNKGVKSDKNWVIEESRFSRRELKKIEAIFTQGNGYLGQRAALEEVYSTETRGLYLAGLYDRFGEEEVTELPNLADFCNIRIFLDDEEFRMVQGKTVLYSRRLNLKDGVITRHVCWEGRNGVEAEFFFERFVSLADKHVIAARVRILPYHRNVKVKIISGINGRMTNSGTQHFHEVETRMHKEKMMEYHTVTGESKIHVLQYSGHRFALNGSPIHPKKTPLIGQRYATIKTEVEVPAGESFVVDKICTVFTDRDPGAEGEKAWDTCSRGRKKTREYLEELNNRWEIREMLPKIRRAAEGIYLPPVGKDGILPQFAGYGKLQEMDLSYYKSFGKNAAAEIRKEHTVMELESFRVHKQADLVLLLQLFPELPEEAGGTQRRQVREKNYEFYEKHTLHEASYSFATHSLMAASLGRTQEAYELFRQCCDVDLSSDGENAPAGIYAACMGGIWQCVVEGFCGVRIEEDALRIDPCLPETWESVKFRICYRKSTLDIKVTKDALTVNNRSSHPVPLSFRGKAVCLDGTVSRIFPLHSPE